MNHHEKSIKLLQRNHYNLKFTKIPKSVDIVDSKKVNRNAIRYQNNSALQPTLVSWITMPIWDSIFKTAGYDEDMDYRSDESINDVNQAILYKATQSQTSQLKLLINHIEKDITVEANDFTALDEATTGPCSPTRASAKRQPL
jgi:hypothetical protein